MKQIKPFSIKQSVALMIWQAKTDPRAFLASYKGPNYCECQWGYTWAHTTVSADSQCSFSVLMRWVNAMKVWANAMKVWANAMKVWANAMKVWANAMKVWAIAMKVWANAIKIQDQHKIIRKYCFRFVLIWHFNSISSHFNTISSS